MGAPIITYEAHLVGLGNKDQSNQFQDNVSYLRNAIGFSNSFSKNLINQSHIGDDRFRYKDQLLYPRIPVNLQQFDYLDPTGNNPMEDVGLPNSTGYEYILSSLMSNQSGEPQNIYFFTDTEERARDIWFNENTPRDLMIFEDCVLDSLSWGISHDSLGAFSFSYSSNNSILIENQNPHSTSVSWNNKNSSIITSVLDTVNQSSLGEWLFLPSKTKIIGAPDFGPIRSIRWSLPIQRKIIYSMGDPYPKNTITKNKTIGKLSIEYNYEGQRVNKLSTNNGSDDIIIETENAIGRKRFISIEGAKIISEEFSSSTESVDSYSVDMEFYCNEQGGIATKIV